MTEIFVSPERIGVQEDYTVVDVRRESKYEDGHLPDAIHIPFDRFRDPGDETEGKLPMPTDFAALLGEVGITPDDRIIAYDDDCGVYASRFLVTAEVLGHDIDRLYLLDGDIETWARSHETTTGVSETRITDYTCQQPSDDPLVSAAELEEAIEEDAVVVDTRDPLEYDTVHLPGAVNFQWRRLVDEQTRRLKPRDDLQSILDECGITPDRPIRLYCNTARRLSFLYAVLRELEYDDIGFYEGGIAAWSEYGGPVETTVS